MKCGDALLYSPPDYHIHLDQSFARYKIDSFSDLHFIAVSPVDTQLETHLIHNLTRNQWVIYSALGAVAFTDFVVTGTTCFYLQQVASVLVLPT